MLNPGPDSRPYNHVLTSYHLGPTLCASESETPNVRIIKRGKLRWTHYVHNKRTTTRAVEKSIKMLKSSGHLKRVGPAKGGRWEVLSDGV